MSNSVQAVLLAAQAALTERGMDTELRLAGGSTAHIHGWDVTGHLLSPDCFCLHPL